MSKLYSHPLKKKKVGESIALIRPAGTQKKRDFFVSQGYTLTHFFPEAKKSG